MIGARIKKVREAMKLTQKEFAKLFGLKQNAISQWEIGNSRVSDEILCDLSQDYNININWLLTGEGEMFTGGMTKEEKEMNFRNQQFLNDIKSDPQLEFILQELRKDKLTAGILYSLLKAKGMDNKEIERHIQTLRSAFGTG
jgi:transcriptional regulator with XRE-family HTH domain